MANNRRGRPGGGGAAVCAYLVRDGGRPPLPRRSPSVWGCVWEVGASVWGRLACLPRGRGFLQHRPACLPGGRRTRTHARTDRCEAAGEESRYCPRPGAGSPTAAMESYRSTSKNAHPGRGEASKRHSLPTNAGMPPPAPPVALKQACMISMAARP